MRLFTFVPSLAGVASDSDYFIRTILGTQYGVANLDGQVNVLDLDQLGQGFQGAGTDWLFGDFTGSGGGTDVLDLDLLGQTFGFDNSAPPLQSVPELTTASLALIAALAGAVRRLTCRHARLTLDFASVPTLSQSNTMRLRIAAVMAGFLLRDMPPLAAATTTYVDPQHRVELSVTASPSTAAGFIAWQFAVAPLDAGSEISSIDAATNAYGFSGAALRQVNPASQPTIFADFNPLFPVGDDGTTDSQFAFLRYDLTILPGSERESSTELEASFTGFPAIRADAQNGRFAQLVLPRDEEGAFFGAFAVRPVEGGAAQLVELGPIEFSTALGDFDLDDDVDGADLLLYQRDASVGDLAD